MKILLLLVFFFWGGPPPKKETSHLSGVASSQPQNHSEPQVIDSGERLRGTCTMGTQSLWGLEPQLRDVPGKIWTKMGATPINLLPKAPKL